MAEKSLKNKEQEQTPPFWEWIIAAFGLILVAGAVGSLVHRAITEETSPPILGFSVESISPMENGHHMVKFRIKNTGTRTAAGLNVEGLLKRGESIVETSTATFAYAPANSEREGALFFTKDPKEFDLQIRALGYENP